MNLEERDLIRQAQQGDAAAMARLFKQHYSFLYKYMLKVTMNPTIAEDMTQDTIVRCIENMSRYNGSSSFSSWMMTVGTRLYIDNTRRRQREKKWMEQEGADISRRMRWQMERQGESWSEMLDGLSRLSGDHRIAILLKHYYGYSYEEIGNMLDIPEGTVKSRTAYGIKQLRKEMTSDVQ
ncbi:RNA polymerase sigma factor SigY [Paenibacillus sp. JCM 10914]|uniref:RNA polymerase sigma factor SigY n=1 Tax=Paenibacillus sp. JCM 10914 TaxID=1236974 RepID=UPI0003CC8598|nr:RNA polymerase sigma factor SigY [Paenibacillus sp. JCM 10914]GAE09969.1 RNA polymerase sigma-70 factor [Paenibacillus sp. JCM 10914]